ncbi:MAG TPA: DUF748 domain-containing protein [Dongiaceae bacterium]|nr:DUF748 domain-containing protein [Dongiaceae bacterium]
MILLVLMLFTCVTVWWGYAHLTSLVQARLKVLVGPDISVGNVTARWNRIELGQVRMARRGSGPFATRFSFERIVIRPSLLSLFSGRLDIREILLEKPYLLVEIDPDGSVVKILPPRTAAPASSSGADLPVRLAAVRISNGTIDLLDWQVARKAAMGVSNPRERYHLTTLQDVSFSSGAVTIPVSDQPMPVRIELASKGGGHLLVAGDVAPKGLDGHLKLDLTGWNITPYRPYFLKQGDLNVSAGTLSATCSMTINQRILNAPGSLHLKGLAFDHSSTRGVLLGVPVGALASLLSDNKDELSVPFTIKGSLDNPRFSIQQSLVNQIATALSSKIGVPTVSGVGKGIMGIGEKGIKGIFGIIGGKK